MKVQSTEASASTTEASSPTSAQSQAEQPTSSIDQNLLRECIRLAGSFLLTDTSMNPEGGLQTWSTGMKQLVEVVIALHKTGTLEVATMAVTSKACEECWVNSMNFPGLRGASTLMKELGLRLRDLLDEDKKSYKGWSNFQRPPLSPTPDAASPLPFSRFSPELATFCCHLEPSVHYRY